MKKYIFLLLLLPTIISAQSWSFPGKVRIDSIYVRGSIRFIPNATITQIDSGMVFRATGTGEFLPSKLKPWDLGIGGNAAADSDFVLKRNGKWESVIASGSSSVEWDSVSDKPAKITNYISSQINIRDNIIEENATNGLGGIHINYSGYNSGITQFRNTYIYDGKHNNVATFYGQTKALEVQGAIDSYSYVNAQSYKIDGVAINFGSFLTSEADGSDTNELQNLTYTESTKALQISAGNTVTISGFLTAEVDGSTTNEIQVLSYDAVNNSIRLSSGGGQVIMDGWATAGHTHSSITQELDLGTLTLVFTNGILTGYY